MFAVGTFYGEMLCLHGKEAASTETEKGKFWYCNRKEKCLVNCWNDDYDLYDNAIKAFLATNQNIPKCCMGEKTRHQARMKVVRDMEKANFGRPFFVCPKQNEPCRYFQWGDQTIVETPLCKHGNPSRLVRVKKEGPNKDRLFFSCMEKRGDQCKFFKWFYGPDPEDPLLPGCIVLFSNPPSYKYTLKKNGAMFASSHSDRKKAYEEFLRKGEKTDPPDIHQASTRNHRWTSLRTVILIYLVDLTNLYTLGRRTCLRREKYLMKNLSKKRKISDETDKLWQKKKEKINESNRIHTNKPQH